MKVEPWDWKRILIGEAPMEFLIEVLIRTIIIYILLLIVVRLMGKRMSGQISVTEFSVMITLGAIVSPAMQLPERAILFGAIALLVIFVLHRLINILNTRSEKSAKIIEGEMSCLVKDGMLQVDEMKKVGISWQELFAELRKRNIELLSSAERVYMEACGLFSVFKASETKPGLLLFPEKDAAMLDYKRRSEESLSACCNCGNVQSTNDCESCKNCGKKEWIEAYT